jgi:hypothetical protein
MKREERGEDGGQERKLVQNPGKPVEHELYPSHNELSPAEHEWYPTHYELENKS